MKKAKKTISIVVAAFAVILTALFLTVTNGLNEAVNVSVGGIDLSKVADGSHTGSYEYKRWSTTVNVDVRDHRIERIDIVKDVGAAQFTQCADETVQRVLDAQDTQVDAVSGVTATSKAYLKAIEDALS